MRILTGLTLLLVLASTAVAEEAGPEQAWQDLQKALIAARQARDYNLYRSMPKLRADEFLAKWAASGKQAEGDERYFLALFYGAASRHLEAYEAFRASVADEALREQLQASAVVYTSQSLSRAIGDGSLSGEKAASTLAEVEGLSGRLGDPTQGSQLGEFHMNLASVNDRLGNESPAVEHYLAAAEANPAMAYSAARGSLGVLTAHAVAMEDYPKIRERGTEIVDALVKRQEAYIASLEESGDNRNLGRARSTLPRMMGLTKPLEMLGKPAEEWTALHHWGETKTLADLKGKVVVLDFWATWCPWCIRSFPALRDLLRDYAGQDLALVGVTAHAGNVWESRYDLDDDLKAKVADGPPVRLNLPRGATAEQTAEFRTKALEMIGAFKKNHEMTWDVVLIDEKEPSAKYALGGWPHAVVLDRQGRIRHFKSGALLRDQPERVAKFRKILDTLLSEK